MTLRRVRMVVIDQHAVARDRIVARLRRVPWIELIATGETADSAIECCARDRPDVLLLDPFVPDGLCSQLVRALLMISPETRIVILTDAIDHPAVADALAAGASGLLLKASIGSAKCNPGHSISDDSYCAAAAAHAGAGSITPRERQVTDLVAAGHTNHEIGSRLGLSNNTVKSYLRNAMHKLHARNRAQLVTNARKHGLV